MVPKVTKRKSQAICPGLDLRPLQQEYRRKLGDVHRFKHLLNCMKAYGLNQLVPGVFDVPSAELMLKKWYEAEITLGIGATSGMPIGLSSTVVLAAALAAAFSALTSLTSSLISSPYLSV